MPELDRAGRTDLHYAANENRVADARMALRAGSDPTLADLMGWTPLHFAAQSQSDEIARMLLDAGAAVDPRDKFGKTPLSVALFNVRDGQGTVIYVLLHAGASPDEKNEAGISPRMFAETVANYDLLRFFQ